MVPCLKARLDLRLTKPQLLLTLLLLRQNQRFLRQLLDVKPPGRPERFHLQHHALKLQLQPVPKKKITDLAQF
jgi:hypothetical protein